MGADWQEPFSKEEMAAMRRAMRDEAGILNETIERLKAIGRAIPFSEDVLAAFYCVRDPQTATRVRLVLLGALAYFVMPVDMMPDFLPILGFTDDAAVLAAAIASVRGAITDAHRDQARARLAEGA